MNNSQRTFWDYAEELDRQENHATDVEKVADAQLETKRQEILSHVLSYSVNSIRDRVAWVLNHYPETRNSDIALQLQYWKSFETEMYRGNQIDLENYFKLTPLTSIARERARIQNQYRLFQARPGIRKARGTLALEEKEKSIADKENHPLFVVYADESGKTSGHLLVGSVWFLTGSQMMPLANEILRFRVKRDFDREFHFKNMKKTELQIYKEFVTIFLEHANAVSFKLISVPRAGTKNVSETLSVLFYHLLVRGIKHEHETGRAPLPRSIQVWKDAEEEGADRLLLANVKDRLQQTAKSIYEDKLTLDCFEPIPSEEHPFMQVADLLTSSVNRVLNRTGQNYTHKDEFAEFLLHALGIDATLTPNDKVADMTAFLSL